MRPIAGGIAVVLAMATAAWAAQANPPLEIDEQARQVLDDFARNDRELKSFQVVIETQIASDFKGQQFKQSSVLRLSAERHNKIACSLRTSTPGPASHVDFRCDGHNFSASAGSRYAVAAAPQTWPEIARNLTPDTEFEGIGFRLAMVPEPSGVALGALGLLSLVFWRLRPRR
jgi:hypothetical protein